MQPLAVHIFSQFTNIRDFNETEAYFSLQNPVRELSVIIRIKNKNGTQQEPEISNFLGQSTDLDSFARQFKVTTDKSHGYSQQGGLCSGDIYFNKSIKGIQTKAKNLAETINTKHIEYCPFITNTVLYFNSLKSNVEHKENGFSNTKELLSKIDMIIVLVEFMVLILATI